MLYPYGQSIDDMSTPEITNQITKRVIRARLVERGTTLRGWAIARGYRPSTVAGVIDRWAGRTEKPNGRIAFRILHEMSQDIGQEIIPGIFDAA